MQASCRHAHLYACSCLPRPLKPRAHTHSLCPAGQREMDVLEKVRRHYMYDGDSPAEQLQTSRDLVDPVKVKAKFAHLLDMQPFIDNIMEGDAADYLHSLEVSKSRERQKQDTAHAGYLPVKLFLSKVRRVPPAAGPLTTLLRFKYGPLHAGLVVGNIMIEWDDSNLVLPLPEPEIREHEFEAYIEEHGSFRRQTSQRVRDMSLANRRNMDTATKLQIIHKTREEKEKLLDCLTDVIVRYNKTKKYSVFKCNCQHFVTECLEALHIQDAPQFKGNLGQYFDTLKRGKVGRMQFDTHAQLDEYVKTNLRTLDKNDKEYLLCLYFQFHTAALGQLTPEEQDAWLCDIQSCLCGELERQVEHQGLFFYEFSRQQSVAPTPPATSPGARQLTLAAVAEEEEGDDRGSIRNVNGAISKGATSEDTDHHVQLEKFMDKDDSTQEQERRLNKYYQSGYASKVMQKLQKCPEFRDKSPEELEQFVDVLSEKEKFREAFLEDLLINETGMGIAAEVSYETSRDRPLTQKELKERADSRFEKLFNFPLNLVLRPSIRGSAKSVAKAPVRLGLQVGDYVYECNEYGLVIPQRLNQVESEPRLLSPVQQKCEWSDIVSKEKGNVQESIQQTIQQNDYNMQISLHIELTKWRDRFFDKFIEKVLSYNRSTSRSCNNAAFLKDAMSALGVRNPGKLSKTIKQHIDQLKPSNNVSTKPTSTHEELDRFVAELSEDSVSREDAEYLIAKYYLLHVAGWEGDQSASYPGPGTASEHWQCAVPSCRLSQLEELLTNLTKITTS